MKLDDFSTVVDNRSYIKPELSKGEQESFIGKLRESQKKNNAEIKTDTRNLGTQVASSIGGLTGGESYFNARYQTPQTHSMVADLRTAAQSQALNEAMQNEIAQAKKRFDDAKRAAMKRERDRASASSNQFTQPEPVSSGVTYKEPGEAYDVVGVPQASIWTPADQFSQEHGRDWTEAEKKAWYEESDRMREEQANRDNRRRESFWEWAGGILPWNWGK